MLRSNPGAVRVPPMQVDRLARNVVNDVIALSQMSLDELRREAMQSDIHRMPDLPDQQKRSFLFGPFSGVLVGHQTLLEYRHPWTKRLISFWFRVYYFIVPENPFDAKFQSLASFVWPTDNTIRFSTRRQRTRKLRREKLGAVEVYIRVYSGHAYDLLQVKQEVARSIAHELTHLTDFYVTGKKTRNIGVSRYVGQYARSRYEQRARMAEFVAFLRAGGPKLLRRARETDVHAFVERILEDFHAIGWFHKEEFRLYDQEVQNRFRLLALAYWKKARGVE